ncbi:porin [Aromatoleum toluolicum]|uniref:Porin n=1 Tax=Aromatoleum toluolicum TaxID=90060 RepID=A0ABX1NBV9_9RHOO|nr:porin [Aromatoleum toluolicum]NMF96761.1 porin [Aromatoleum toluolicum]
MQKKLIALAIAGLASAPVFAQTNVTVYGVVDVTVESVKASGGVDVFELDRRTRVTSNSSLIGFRGTEDLGNGLKALFQVESSFSADAGGGTLAGRDTFVGLEGGFGKVQLGKLTTIMRAAGAKVDFNPAATGIGFQAATYGTIGGVALTGIDERINNAVMYTTPNFSGLTAQLAYSAGENRVSPDLNGAEGVNSQSYQLAAAYENGPLYVSAGYAVAQDPLVATSVLGAASNSNISDELKDARIAVKYTFPSNTSVSALYDRAKYEASSALGDTDVKRNAWMVGAEQKFGGNQAVYLQYARSQELDGDACDFDACDNTEFSQWTLGYTYALSKRTMVKAYYTRLNNDSDSAADFYLSKVGMASRNAGADPSGFGLGLRHTF